MNNGIILHNPTFRDYFLAPSALRFERSRFGGHGRNLYLPVDFAFRETDEREHRTNGFLLTAVWPPPGVVTIVERLFSPNVVDRRPNCPETYRDRTPTTVVFQGVSYGAIYDFQSWNEDSQLLLQVCAMPV